MAWQMHCNHHIVSKQWCLNSDTIVKRSYVQEAYMRRVHAGLNCKPMSTLDALAHVEHIHEIYMN